VASRTIQQTFGESSGQYPPNGGRPDGDGKAPRITRGRAMGAWSTPSLAWRNIGIPGCRVVLGLTCLPLNRAFNEDAAAALHGVASPTTSTPP
jgi:hypothetical protein